jgi:FkbM family methyltransferase
MVPIERSLARLAASRLGGVLRAAANPVLGRRPRVVRVLTGVARGARLELDLTREKAYWLGHHEPEVQELLATHVVAGDVVYDVGAHLGFFSICAARLGAKVYAFEPSPANAERLRRNVRLNGFDIEVVEAAAWDDDRGVELVPGDSGSEWQVRAGGVSPSVTLDAFVANHHSPSFVKIDAEGAELRILSGAQETLRSIRPVVVCELHGPTTSEQLRGLLAGYRIETPFGAARLVAVPERRR